MTHFTAAADELAAMRRIVTTLDKLDPTAQQRVVHWLFDRYIPLSDKDDE